MLGVAIMSLSFLFLRNMNPLNVVVGEEATEK